MIRHTEARDAYESVLNGARIFPFNETMRIANGRSNVLTGMVYLWKYFRGIKSGIVGDFNKAGEVWRSILQFVPDHKMTTDYDILFEYFNQKLDYTPINIHKNSLSYC